MLLFDEKYSIKICCKNKNEYVKLAVLDMADDFKRMNKNGVMPLVVDECEDACIVIEENTNDSEPIADESFSIKQKEDKIHISAKSYLGTMWGIYTFSEKLLGVDPCYLFNDMEPEKKTKLEVNDIDIEDAPVSFGFRGVFVNDEDLLTGWKNGGGIRHVNWIADKTTVPEVVINKVVETMLRLRLNLIIPATYLNIDNPSEKLIADCAVRRGMYISQHHIEPVGVSAYTFKNYCDKFGKKGEFSFTKDPELMKEVWSYYAQKWSGYENVVWQIGLRGEGDRPVWQEEKELSENLLKEYGNLISSAANTQVEIIKQATNGRAKHFTSTLWMEGSMLMEKGMLDLPEETTVIFADNGPNQMFAPEFYKLNRNPQAKYGIYYHLQYFNLGPHLSPMTGIDKLYHNINLCIEKGDTEYIVLNCSNVREFVFELRAYSQMTWNIENFSKEKYMNENTELFGEYSDEIKGLINDYYDSVANLDISMLKYMYGEYFNYDYTKQPEGIKICPIKDGCVIHRGGLLIHHFTMDTSQIPDWEFYGVLHSELKKSVVDYQRVCDGFEKVCSLCDENLQRHIKAKWLNYAYTMKCLYEWFVALYEAKLCYDVHDSTGFISSLEKGCASLEFNIEYRKNAEYGDFENWYRGEILTDVKNMLHSTKRIMGRS